MNGTSSKASSSTAELRQRYNAATRAFLVRDYALTASALHDARSLVAHVAQGAWFDALQQGVPPPLDVSLRRKLDVLELTFLATVRSSPAALAPSPALKPLLELPSDKLVQTLWRHLLSGQHSQADPAEGDGDILPSPQAAFLHPSLAVALALAALKLEQPLQAKHVVEAWFGSVSEEVERIVFDTSGEIDGAGEGARDFALDAVGGRGSSALSGSSMLNGAGAGSDQPAAADKTTESRRQLVAAWLKLLDLLVLHVLPKLGEWEAAGDFVRLQGVENGGWVPDERVEAALHRLTELQQEEAHTAALRAQRERDLEAARTAAAAASSASQKRSSRRSASSEKGKARARDNSPTESDKSAGSSPGKKSRKGAGGQRGSDSSRGTSAHQTPRASPPLAAASSSSGTSGFAGLRDSLGSYLAPRSTSAASRTPASPARSFLSYLQDHYSTDPVRLLSIICFVFAFVAYVRRRRARGEKGLGIREAMKTVGAKVFETVGMVMKVTAL
ncbi:hypothetical protein Rhopal_003218-T1 [Rhodotorula paludigena]|uniref:Uncharacterized protein n=1 Tax=Rhodotorula paludigena TaxID=86838 RepID=A0AAV5GID2_9BASI|nr:hypothetical protein Rhopal_003218-T1 [Rhodotorula paludigena]